MYRAIPMTEQAFETFVRDVLERLDKLEGGSILRGRASFGKVIRIGDVEVSALPGGGEPGSIQVTVRNVVTGSEQVLATLP